jgi:hypothetical protein
MNFDDLKKVSKARNAGWNNWAKFEKVGDKVEGYIRDVFYKAEDGQYGAARGITLENPVGKFTNVSIKRIPFVLKDTDGFRLGDPLKIELTELKPSAIKGYSATKILSFYGANLPENASNPTVYELDLADQKMGGTANGEEKVEAPKDPAEGVPFP